LPALVLLRKPLFGLAKRRKQPERYAKLGLKFFVNIDKIIVYDIIKNKGKCHGKN
jgi:hypothetical protein